MVEKKKETPEEELDENQAEAVATSENAEQLSAEVDALKKKLAEAESKSSEYKDSWLRSQAEFQNYRKRIERDNELTYISLKGDIIKKILPILDDLERALQNRSAGDAWANGVELIARKFQNILESEGLKKIEAIGMDLPMAYKVDT
jgi:molecular chaperone GrpE